ncbi:MAG: efflux RND transporter permease subunit [Candidatus Cloacimonetes bacterium]|nr:efflux RND transporter permease subunit [Candidatus Cloacimonadota bacterium]
MSIAKFSVENTVLINMLMVVVFIMGIFAIIDIPKEAAPAVDFGSAVVTVLYPGVSPEEIENLIIKKIEDQLQNLDDVDYISSTAQEGRANIRISFDAKANADDAWDQLNEEMNKITDLPEDAQDPVLIQIKMREVNEICDISMFGQFSGNTMREIAEDLQEQLNNVDYVSKVEVFGTQERQIHINADLEKLNHYGLSLSDINNAIQTRNINMPGGTVDFGKAEFIIRSMGEFQTVQEIVELRVKTDTNGRMLLVDDIAIVADTLEEKRVISKLDNKPSINFSVYKKAEGNIIDVMKNIRQVVKDFESNVPGLTVTVRNDDSTDVKNSVNTLGSSAIFGIVLVFFILWLFIGWRNALLAAWGIPFSFMLTFIVLRFTDITMNNLSLFALVLVLGMIVDDAIVVIENIYRYIEKGYAVKDAVITGVKEVTWPVIAAIATTCAAFLPISLTEGIMGKFIRVFPIVVSIALVASLFECLVVLPAHVSEVIKPKIKKQNEKAHFYEKLQKKYRKLLRIVLCKRGLAVTVVSGLLLLSLSALFLGWVKFDFFPTRTPTSLNIKVRTPIGTNLETTDNIISNIENFILNMPEKEDVKAIVTTVGQLRENMQWRQATSNAEMRIELVEANNLKFDLEKTKKRIRDYLDDLPGIYTYRFGENRQGAPVGRDVELRVKGENLERLEYIGKIIISELEKLPGVSDLEDSFSPGKEEVRLRPYHEKLALNGITVTQIASLIRTASAGNTLSKYRGSGFEEYDIVLKAQDYQINDFEDLKHLQIRNNKGQLIQLDELVYFDITKGLAEIEHRDRKRIITITGNASFYEVNGKFRKRTSNEINEYLFGNKLRRTTGVLSTFSQRFPGYQIETGGIAEDQRRSYSSLISALAIALLLVYSVLAAQFKSYVQPLIVMLTIPFGFIGVILGLLITNLPFSLTTMISVVALSGVVVNDSLVLVDFINKERENGKDRWHSIISAGSIRLRPIILTTVTTIGGLLPMLLSTSEASADWRPMAVSISFGLGFATILTLFIIPCVYSFVDSFFGRFGITRFNEHTPICMIKDEDFDKSE